MMESLIVSHRPMSEQGTPSELTAAVLYFPRRVGDGGENGASDNLDSKMLSPTARATTQLSPRMPMTHKILLFEESLCCKQKKTRVITSHGRRWCSWVKLAKFIKRLLYILWSFHACFLPQLSFHFVNQKPWHSFGKMLSCTSICFVGLGTR